MDLSLSAGLGSASSGNAFPQFIGAAGAGDSPVSTGGSNDNVFHKTNGVYELKTDTHGRSGYDEGYYWKHLDISSPNYRIMKKSSDGTWSINDQNTVRYTNPDTGSVPPASGWVTESDGTAPPPTLLFNTLMTEQASLSLTNVALVSRNLSEGEVTFKSTTNTSTSPKIVEFGDGTGISDGDLYAIGYEIKDDGNVSNAANVRFGVNDFVRASSLFGGSTTYRGEGWSQEFGKDRHGNDEEINTSRGFQINHYGNVWSTDEEVTIKNFRIMIA